MDSVAPKMPPHPLPPQTAENWNLGCFGHKYAARSTSQQSAPTSFFGRRTKGPEEREKNRWYGGSEADRSEIWWYRTPIASIYPTFRQHQFLAHCTTKHMHETRQKYTLIKSSTLHCIALYAPPDQSKNWHPILRRTHIQLAHKCIVVQFNLLIRARNILERYFHVALPGLPGL